MKRNIKIKYFNRKVTQSLAENISKLFQNITAIFSTFTICTLIEILLLYFVVCLCYVQKALRFFLVLALFSVLSF